MIPSYYDMNKFMDTLNNINVGYSRAYNNAKHRIDMMIYRDRIRSWIRTTRKYLYECASKHTKFVLVPKHTIYCMLDELNDIANSMYSPVGFMSDNDVAKNTIDRLVQHASSDPSFPISIDEAENLQKILRKNYTKGTKI